MPSIQVPSQSFTVSAVSYGSLTLTANSGSASTNLYAGLVGNLVKSDDTDSVQVKIRAVESDGVVTCVLWDGAKETPADLVAYDDGVLCLEPQLASLTIPPILATGAEHTVDDVILVLQALGIVKQA